MNCSVCRKEFEAGDRVQYNHRETFVFKPANVPDVPMTRHIGGKEIIISTAAVLSPQELLESRKEHLRTTVATTYAEYGAVPIPDFAFGMRHVACVQMTGASAGLHATTKHHQRYQRNAAGRKMH